MPPDTPPGQDHSVQIILDGKQVTAPSHRQNGLQIRQLGDPSRVTGFSTVLLHPNGKKDRTIRDDETIELHKDEKFETVPSEGGPGASY